MSKDHTIRRFATFSSESFHGEIVNGIFSCKAFGGNELKESEKVEIAMISCKIKKELIRVAQSISYLYTVQGFATYHDQAVTPRAILC